MGDPSSAPKVISPTMILKDGYCQFHFHIPCITYNLTYPDFLPVQESYEAIPRLRATSSPFFDMGTEGVWYAGVGNF